MHDIKISCFWRFNDFYELSISSWINHTYGRRSDGGIFRDSLLDQKFRNNEMNNVPDPEPFYFEGDSIPYVLIGGEAFPLTEYLMRLFSGKQNLNQEKIIYNYRLNRTLRILLAFYQVNGGF